MALIDTFARLCGTGQAVLDTNPGEVSSAWIDMGGTNESKRIFGGGRMIVAKFGCTVTVTSGDPDNTVNFSIVHSPVLLTTPTQARTISPTFTNATNIVNATAHGLINGTRVVITATGGIPTGLAVDTNYYVRDAATNTFKISATPGGAEIDFTTDGTPAHTMRWFPEVIASTGPIGFNRIIANDFVREIAIGPHELSRLYPVGRYLYAFFDGVSDITAGTFTCDLTGGFAMDGRPFNKLNYVTA